MEDKQYQEIPLDKIIIPKERARATFTEEQKEELKASIKENGFTIPILVRPVEGDKFELIDGEHRIAVVKELGWDKIPAIITTTDEKRAAILNFLANTARGTQNPIDISEALNRAKAGGATEEELAAATGHTKDWVIFYLRLKELPEPYRTELKELRLPLGVVREALRLPNPNEVDALLQTALQLGWTVSTTKIAVDNRLAELDALRKKAEMMNEPVETPPPNYEELVKYDDCMICKRKVPRGHTWMKVICDDCLALLGYIIGNLGDPKEAMDYVYKALSEKMERDKYEELKKKFEPEVKKEEAQSQEKGKPPFPISG